MGVWQGMDGNEKSVTQTFPIVMDHTGAHHGCIIIIAPAILREAKSYQNGWIFYWSRCSYIHYWSQSQSELYQRRKQLNLSFCLLFLGIECNACFALTIDYTLTHCNKTKVFYTRSLIALNTRAISPVFPKHTFCPKSNFPFSQLPFAISACYSPPLTAQPAIRYLGTFESELNIWILLLGSPCQSFIFC